MHKQQCLVAYWQALTVQNFLPDFSKKQGSGGNSEGEGFAAWLMEFYLYLLIDFVLAVVLKIKKKMAVVSGACKQINKKGIDLPVKKCNQFLKVRWFNANDFKLRGNESIASASAQFLSSFKCKSPASARLPNI